MITAIQSLGLTGIDPFYVRVEVDLSRAMPSFDIVGLPDAAVRESRERVRAAVVNRRYPFPEGRIIVNLAPADVRKSGSLYDLPIFIGLLQGQGALDSDLTDAVFLGELSLAGEVRQVNGVLPMLLGAQEFGVRRAFIPAANAAEASCVRGMEVFAVQTVDELVQFLRGEGELPRAQTPAPDTAENGMPQPDFSEVKGQELAKRALEIAAAGGHNLLMLGPPGTGKSMLAKRLPSILPAMTEAESVETTKIYSACGLLPDRVPLITTRPFRSPHYSTSVAGLCGGGAVPRPGEISLAHNGVLFLDELPEFSRGPLESLRQPMEDGWLTISRAKISLRYPCRFMLVAAMNPCPCGYLGQSSDAHPCTCSDNQISRYRHRISGPLLDRLDLHVEVASISLEQLSSIQPGESSAQIKSRVSAARALQLQRYREVGITCNAHIPPSMLNEICPLSSDARKMFERMFEKMGYSGRAYDRILKVARTIADLAGDPVIGLLHLSEAIQYRSLDRKYRERPVN